MRKLMMQAVLAAILATVSSMALAQPANDAATTVPVDTRNQDRGFDDWGLLGLLGLLGLVGRKRRDVGVNTRTSANQTR